MPRVAPPIASLPNAPDDKSQRVVLLGATGTIGRATLRALLADGHRVTCVLRPGTHGQDADLPATAILRHADVTDAAALARDGFGGDSFDVLVTCMASRSGTPLDAWAIDHRAHLNALDAARAAGVRHVVLLSAICVQRPKLAFQQAKLATEAALQASGLSYSIVRPTAFFKSLSGQVARLRAGKPFLIFGDGTLTACKPISDADLARLIADCVTNPARRNRILPIGGPGPAITPLEQGQMLFDALGLPPRFRRVPVALLDTIIAVLSVLGTLSPRLRDKAELARIGRYYATESMLLWNAYSQRYDAQATPEFGHDTLAGFYRDLAAGDATVDLGDHAVF